ncbi:transient receptor potential cation channel protein painless-like [Anopheles ziemanni]|uniref:transient receptor potential cation channel protein painless-like n=1 Tax=Anopheles coustani TaxID=139045 RepID=UPI002657E913|nr:transient receptor potential cation channel protein painless-like [Anopheles coustani]XP_058169163.1 transient receptor potential cation channel protein painless-like [Anopheles ziemanni]
MSLFQDRKQAALENALLLADLKKFQLALKNGARVDLRVGGTNYTIFETACNTKGRHEFIRACFNENLSDPDPRHKKNSVTHEYPIHLAALSMDKDNLTALLDGCPQLDTLVEQRYKDRTALFLLFERLSISNKSRTTKCIEVLLNNGANINTHDRNQVTAIELLLRGKELWRKQVLQHFLNTGKVLLHPELRRKIQRAFPDIKLPEGDGRRLLKWTHKLETDSDQECIEDYEREATKDQFTAEETRTMLSSAISHDKEQMAQKLLEKETNTSESKALLAHGLVVCCKYGKDYILECLLKKITSDMVEVINENLLLSMLTKQINGNSDKRQCGFFKCMEKLLEVSRIDVNKIDDKAFTALHYAVKFRLEHVQELLLKNGAYLGGKDLFGRALICELNPYLLYQHLNRCVTDNGTNPDDQDYMINVNFRNFQSPTHTDEMLPIVRLAQSSAGRELLGHPVLASILLIKWLRISVFFYLNLIICSMFFFSFTAFMVFYYGTDSHNLDMWYFLAPTFLGLAYITVREITQFVLNTRSYIRSVENHIELMLILSSAAALTLHFTSGDAQIRNIAEVCAIMLSAVEFTVLLATIPRLSFCTHMVMLKTVAKNFIQCLALYSMILVGFAISFYTLFRGPNGNGGAMNGNNNATDTEESNPFNEFGMLSMALLKTTVMMTGEFEAAELKLHQSWGYYVLFGLFLFFVPIVLYNLMNGLAVNDAANIQMQSELIAIRQKVFVINSCESTLKAFNRMRKVWNRCFDGQPGEMMNNFEYICISPNKGNRILVPCTVIPDNTPNVDEPELKAVTVVNGITADVAAAQEAPTNGTAPAPQVASTADKAPATDGTSTDGGAPAATDAAGEVVLVQPAPIPEPIVAAEATTEDTGMLHHLSDSDQGPNLSELPGRMDHTVVTAALGILCSKDDDATNQDLKMQQSIYHLSQEIATMNNLLMAKHQHEFPQLGSYPIQQAGKYGA